MYVGVKFYKPELNAYSGRVYIYHTTLPLEVGNKVLVPTQKAEEQKAIVVEVGFETPKFPCKEIAQLDVEE